jgi:D-alanyl-D-alanine carboxypeptidase
MVESGEASLDDEVTVSEEAAFFAQPMYSNAGLQAGDVLSVRELLMATLIPSGNDAATALAHHLGGGGERGVERFVDRMSHEAREMGLEDTRLGNVTGLDGRNHRSSVRDLADMACEGLSYPLFAEAVSTLETTISTPEREIYLRSTNDLLVSYARATGVKTGTSPAAGPSLVASAAANDESYVAVLLGAEEDRFAGALRVLEHGFVAYERPEIVKEGERYARVEAPYRRDESIPLLAERDVEGLVDDDSKVSRETTVMEELPDSARRGAKLGEVVVTVDGERVGSSPLVAGRGYDEASVWERVWYTVEGVFE